MCYQEQVVAEASDGGKHLRIIVDDDPVSPREWDNLGVIVSGNRQYELGEIEAHNTHLYGDWDEWLEEELLADHEEGDIVYLPLYIYDHSGITIRTRPFHCPWDSGQIGFIYCTKDRFIENTGYTAERFHELCPDMLEREIEVFDQYLTGDVYGFEYDDGEEMDSCWGFFGHDWENNGIADHLPEDAVYLLSRLEVM